MDILEGLAIDERIILKWISKKLYVMAWIELIWLRIAISYDLLIITFLMETDFDKMRGTA